jgi:hypothetical protein
LRAVFISAADSSLISARSETMDTRWVGKRRSCRCRTWPGRRPGAAGRRAAVPGPGPADFGARPGRPAGPGPGRRGGTTPGRSGCAAERGPSPAGKRVHQARVADERLGLFFRAPVAGEQPVIGVDDLDGHQALEQVPDMGADRSVGYHQPTPQPRSEASGEPPWSAPGLRTARHKGSGRNWPGSACSLVHRTPVRSCRRRCL